MALEPFQTSYTSALAPFVLGQIPDMRTPGQDVSRNVQTPAGIPFGVAVGQGTADRQIRRIATGQATKLIGVTVLDTTQAVDNYALYQAARVRTEGPIVVNTSIAVAAGDPAFVVPATGVFTNVATANTAIGKFETSGAANALVILNVKL